MDVGVLIAQGDSAFAPQRNKRLAQQIIRDGEREQGDPCNDLQRLQKMDYWEALLKGPLIW